MKILSAILLVLVAIVCSSPASAYTEEQRIACQGDAMRFCGSVITPIPDEERIKNCLVANLSRLSPACRGMFRPPARR